MISFQKSRLRSWFWQRPYWTERDFAVSRVISFSWFRCCFSCDCTQRRFHRLRYLLKLRWNGRRKHALKRIVHCEKWRSLEGSRGAPSRAEQREESVSEFLGTGSETRSHHVIPTKRGTMVRPLFTHLVEIKVNPVLVVCVSCMNVCCCYRLRCESKTSFIVIIIRF